MDYQIVSASSTTDTKDKWVGPGLYRLMSVVKDERFSDGKYLAVDGSSNLVAAGPSKKNNDPKQQWQIAYAGKRHLKDDPKENFVTEFFLINAESGKYLLANGDKLTMDVSPPTFGGNSRWVLANPRIQKGNQTFDDRYIFYRKEQKKALACHGDKITLIEYDEKKSDGNQHKKPGDEDDDDQCQWYIVDNIVS